MDVLDKPDINKQFAEGSESDVFSEKMIRFLLNNYGVEGYPAEEDCPFFTKDMGEAVVTISNIFQRKYRKACHLLRESLRNTERFKKYCMLVPVQQDKRYFYSLLRRVSFIYEIAMYCYMHQYSGEEGYFSLAYRYIGTYTDSKYFSDMGGWERLKYVSTFLANVGRPLKLIMKDALLQDQSILTFSDAVGNLHKEYLYSANTKMLDSEEMLCLEDLSKLNKALSKERLRRKRSSSNPPKHSPSKKANLGKTEEEILMKYFQCCLRSEKGLVTCHATPDIPSDSSVKSLLELDSQLAFSKTMVCGSEMGDILNENVVQDNSQLIVGSNRQNNNLSTPLQQTIIGDSSETGENLTSSCIDDLELVGNVTKAQKVDSEYCMPEKQENLSETELSDSSLKPTKIVGETSRSSTGKSEIRCTVGEPSRLSKITSEIECPVVVEERVAKHNFIVPEKYFLMCDQEDWDDYRYLNTAKIDPPSKKFKMTKYLKGILDTNIDNQNYRLTVSKDVLVSSPGSSSQEEETLLVFIDSSSDEEGDEDIDRLICLFKKCDLDYESKKGGTYKLRPRKPSIPKKDVGRGKSPGKGSAHKELKSAKSPTKSDRRSKRRTVLDIEDQPAYVKYLTKLYKRNLPHILEDCMNAYETEHSQNISNVNQFSENESAKSSPIIVVKLSTIFVTTSAVLVKRKLDLREDKETQAILGELETSYEFTQFKPLTLLHEEKVFNSYILSGKYEEIYQGVYTVGEFSSDCENWFLFEPQKPTMSLDEHHSEMLRVTRMYKEAILNRQEFTDVTQGFLTCIENALLRLLPEE